MYAVVANFSDIKGTNWLVKSYMESRNAVRFFVDKENAIRALVDCPPIAVSFPHKLQSYTPDVVLETRLRSGVEYPVAIDGEVRGFLFYIHTDELGKNWLWLPPDGVQTNIRMTYNRRITEVVCEGYHSYTYTLPGVSYVLHLTRKDKDIEIVSTKDTKRMHQLLGGLPEIVIEEEKLEMSVDMTHWEKVACLLVATDCLLLSCWEKFPVEKEDSE